MAGGRNAVYWDNAVGICSLKVAVHISNFPTGIHGVIRAINKPVSLKTSSQELGDVFCRMILTIDIVQKITTAKPRQTTR